MIPDQEKEHIKSLLPGLLLSINSKLFKLLAAGANVITVIDFPDKWPKLLPVRFPSSAFPIISDFIRRTSSI